MARRVVSIADYEREPEKTAGDILAAVSRRARAAKVGSHGRNALARLVRWRPIFLLALARLAEG